MRLGARRFFALVVFLSAAFVACQPPPPRVPGALCQTGEAVCTGPNGALVCAEGRLVGVACRGESGCRVDPARNLVLCDESTAIEGEACFRGPWVKSAAACSVDRKAYLTCQSGRFAPLGTCRGPRGCFREGDMLRCDNALAEVGDTCDKSGLACSVDGKSLLDCVDRKYGVKAKCQGPKGCVADESSVRCDERLGAIGDACGPGLACDLEHKNALKCEGGKLALLHPCRGKDGCAFDGDGVACDRSAGEVGDACDGGATCTVDAKSLLKCKDGHLAIERACPKGCTFDKAQNLVGCR